MISEIALDRTTTALHKALNASTLRHSVIANNIANVNTPGFKSKTVTFEKDLARSLDTMAMRGTLTDAKHIPLGAPTLDRVYPKMISHNDERVRNDHNGVDVEVEMAEMAKNQFYYSACAERISGKFSMLSQILAKVR